MFVDKLNFIKLKFFFIFSEYFIGIMFIYILVVFVLLISNIYGILIQKIASEIIAFILLFACFLMLKDKINILLLDYTPTFFWLHKFMSFSLFSKFTKIIVCFFLVLFFFIISNFLKNYKLTSFEYLLLLLLCSLGLILLCSANDFITVFLAIELISLCSYLLAAFKKFSSYSLESGVKYLIIGAISSSFFLLGSSFIYAYTGSITLVDIKLLIGDPSKNAIINNFIFFIEPKLLIQKFDYLNYFKFFQKNNLGFYKCYTFFIEIGVTFIIFSIFIKLALAPFHFWSLDVYEGSPSISTFFFSTFTKLSFFVFLSRFCLTFHIYYGELWIFLNIIIGFLSIFVGSFGGIRQKKLKTLLAYSSISHMGYSLLAFSNFTILGFEMLYFYLFTYILSNIIIWCTVLGLVKIKKNYPNKLTKDINDFVLLSKSHAFLAFGLSLAFFSLAGIPPLLGFIAKLGIFLNLITQQFYILASIILLCSIISTFYYIRLIKILYFENLLTGKLYSFKLGNLLIFCFSVFLLIFLFFNPTMLYLIIQKMLLLENLKSNFDLFEYGLENSFCNLNNHIQDSCFSKLIFELVWF